MDITIIPGKLHGSIQAVPSKSHAHRLLICAAFADEPTDIICRQSNRDIDATIRCLNSLGAEIQHTDYGYRVLPVETYPANAYLDCDESGATLRFLLPIVCALGIETIFTMRGKLASRPISPLLIELERHGCTLTRTAENEIKCAGKLLPGHYVIDGSISSQFVSGLLFAMALMSGNSRLSVTGQLASQPYIELTQQVLSTFGVQTHDFCVNGHQKFLSPGAISVEGDWSNAAFFLCAAQLGNPILVTELNPNSTQGDKAIIEILRAMRTNCTIDVTNVPDLFPILAIVAGASHGARFINISRLRHKESDRVTAVESLLNQLGAATTVEADSFTVIPASYNSCNIESYCDHRIAMAAAIAATVATGPITIRNAECVAKSYPSYWDDYKKLGGIYEQHLQ